MKLQEIQIDSICWSVNNTIERYFQAASDATKKILSLIVNVLEVKLSFQHSTP